MKIKLITVTTFLISIISAHAQTSISGFEIDTSYHKASDVSYTHASFAPESGVSTSYQFSSFTVSETANYYSYPASSIELGFRNYSQNQGQTVGAVSAAIKLTYYIRVDGGLGANEAVNVNVFRTQSLAATSYSAPVTELASLIITNSETNLRVFEETLYSNTTAKNDTRSGTLTLSLQQGLLYEVTSLVEFNTRSFETVSGSIEMAVRTIISLGSNEVTHGYTLQSSSRTTPAPVPTVTPVPEPSTYAACAAGSLGLLALLRRRRRAA